jgi:hypothetical protein
MKILNLVATELAWAAGFVDGEGNIRFNTYKRPDGRLYGTLQLGVSQTHIAVLERLQAALGHRGKIYGPYKPKTQNSKPYWTFLTKGFEHTQASIALIWNWLSPVKREQVKHALSLAAEQSRTLKYPNSGKAARLREVSI